MKTEHEELVRVLAKKGHEILDSLDPVDCHNIHMVLGISGETGELLDAVKKSVIYRKPLDLQNVIEEMGDIEFYMEGLRQSLGITRDQTLEANTAKLLKRYPHGIYTNGAAQARADKEENQ